MNETMFELRERSDKAAIDELMIRAEEPQIPTAIYYGQYDLAFDIMMQQRIEAQEWMGGYEY